MRLVINKHQFVKEEYKQKLARVTQVRKELKSHIQSLPDLSLLPNSRPSILWLERRELASPRHGCHPMGVPSVVPASARQSGSCFAKCRCGDMFLFMARRIQSFEF
ncbi:UNVERIFIED_CONTAM: hypothetical protein K2H54_073635 [Gekko kuhli]